MPKKSQTISRGRGRPPEPRPDTAAGRFGAKIVELRKARGWSAIELSARASLGYGTVAAIEAGSSEPKISTALALARALNIGIEQLIQ